MLLRSHRCARSGAGRLTEAKAAPRRLHITGASGSGVSTLGAALAQRLACAHLDTDDFYWLPTDPPYRGIRERSERLALLTAAMDAAPSGWVLSGSLDGWGDPLIPRFEQVIFLQAPTDLRLARLAERERLRNGAAIEPGGPLHAHHLDFMAYAAGYDTGVFTGVLTGRHLARHEAWFAGLPCPVLRLDGAQTTKVLTEMVMAACKVGR
ncbi:MAG TPA: AAA family ATPase [Caulobacteraceae bacterium]